MFKIFPIKFNKQLILSFSKFKGKVLSNEYSTEVQNQNVQATSQNMSNHISKTRLLINVKSDAICLLLVFILQNFYII